MNPLPHLYSTLLAVFAACVTSAASGLPPELKLSLPEGFAHKPAKPGLTVSGVLERADGLAIRYEIGIVPKKGQAVVTGRFKNRAVQVGQGGQAKWTRQENINGQPGYFAYDTKGVLHASFPLEGVNFRAEAPTEAAVEAVMAVLRTFGLDSDGGEPLFAPLSVPFGAKGAPVNGEDFPAPVRLVSRVQI